ncbi:MAG TPA: GNAT family N-acetyltransferase [Candidatus Limnocylindrales bacterium]
MPVIVREARPEEHATLGELVVAAYRSLPEFDEPGYEPELRDVARRAREAVVLVALDESADSPLLGCVTYVPGPESPWAELLEPGEAAIRMLAVDAAARGRGAGTALAAACVARARAEGRAAIFLHSLPYMRAAQVIYARLGFTRRPDRDWEPVPGVRLLGFSLPLEGRRG